MSRGNSAVVWVVNDEGRYEFEAAQTYGEVRPLLVGKVNIFDTEAFLNELRTRLAYWKEGDHLLLAGHALLCWAALDIVLARQGQCPCLVYGARDKDYIRLVLRDQRQQQSPGVMNHETRRKRIDKVS